jgi:hypothetical protein
MPSLSRSFKPAAVALLVPVVFACELLLPEQADLHIGVREALGCSGSGSVAPPSSGFQFLKPRLPGDANSKVVPVATDGFFAIDATAYQLSAEAATSGLQIVVKNAAGESVAGETKLLSGEQGPQFVFGWSASARLEPGAELKASLSAAPLSSLTTNVGGEYQLEVAGEPTPLPEPSFTFSSWLDYYRGVDGALASCPGNGGRDLAAAADQRRSCVGSASGGAEDPERRRSRSHPSDAVPRHRARRWSPARSRRVPEPR